MRYTTAFALASCLGCAAPKPAEVPPPKEVIIDIEPINYLNLGENLSSAPEKLPFKQVMNSILFGFEKIMRQQKTQLLEGKLYLENSNDSFGYAFDPSIFCDPFTKKTYSGKITIQYHSSQELENGEYEVTLTTLTDVQPFGSVDKAELFVSRQARTLIYANYEIGTETEKLYERLLRQLYAELQLHAKNSYSWENFTLKKITKDKKGDIPALHQKLIEQLSSKKPRAFEKIPVYISCEGF